MRRWKFVLIGLGIVLSMGYLVVSSIQATGVPYKHVHELAAMESDQAEQYVKVTGKVRSGSMDYDPHAPEIDFRVEGSEGESVRVIYEGLKPDAMVEGSHVILEGSYDTTDQVLRAETLLAKCPSRYKSEYSGERKSSSSE